ncbi:protein of unknown function DUF342 [Denitrovibrio acetiphilus DSM 12809]|uniref:Flagellar Assembly Protein A N-terminal region domain-containing protein n=1 Tax=Denitrovibrio acetiphilus (strain DSM 12809 / NBRC 114555 / N2460) TaxID=522772 RepID=D4H2V4_DENA2|nr:FapA family protein [Denitrovibrio acetiphilus]ADD68977.1 protein of unknown function DUF342 [Denitrovibrio acetiphilus DSM 12809]
MSDINDVIGSLFEEDEPSGETPFIEISEDGMIAYLIIPPKALPVDVRILLSELNITFGIDHELVTTVNKGLYDKLKLEPKYQIAAGRSPVHGQPGELILRTNQPEDVILSSEDLTKVDYKTYKRKMLALGEKEKPVAMIIQPTKGYDGIDVFGQTITGNDGEEVDLILGENVYQSGRKIISKIDGLVEYNKNKGNEISIDVSEVYLIKGDVDYNTGNVDFPGSVIVKGVVKAGFEVRAKNDVVAETISGNVYAGGSVVSKQGIIGGTEKAYIECNGPVYAKFMQYAKVVSGGAVSIKKSIVMSEVYSEDVVSVEGSPGSIIGGSIYAVNGISAKVFGSESYVKTELALYQSANDVILLRDIVARRFEISKDLTRIETYLGADRHEYLRKYPGDKQELVNKLMKKRDELRKQLLEKNTELKYVQKMLTTPMDGHITVEKAIWPEVRVSISGKFILLKNERGKGYFYFDKGEERIDFR